MKSLALAVLFAGSAWATDWQHYRGPAQDGSTPEKVGAFAGSGPRELWRAQLGTGLSSVTVAGGKVFSAGYKDGKEVLYCLDSANGKMLWMQAWPAKKGDNLFEGGPRVTPTVDSQRV